MIYYTILSITFLLSVFEIFLKRNRQILKMLSIILLFIIISVFIGFRWDTGSDWDVYLYNYYNSNVTFEFGYSFLEQIFNSNNIEYSYFLFFISSISLFFIFYFLNRSMYYVVPCIMFFVANYMLSFMGGNRQIIAIGIILVSNIFILKKKPVSFLITVFIATFFHVSSIVYIFVYFLNRVYFNPYRRYILLICIFIFATSIGYFVIDIAEYIFGLIGYEHVVNKINIYKQVIFDNYSILSSIKKILMLIFFDFYYYNILKNRLDGRINLFFNLYFVSIIFDLLFGQINGAFLRASVYFRISEIILVSIILKNIYDLKAKILFLIFLFLLSLRQLNSALNFYPELYKNYKSILF